MSTLMREFWNGKPSLGEAWRLHKVSCGQPKQAVCELSTHEFGHEFRLIANAAERLISEN
jgi:hypothetical protein